MTNSESTSCPSNSLCHLFVPADAYENCETGSAKSWHFRAEIEHIYQSLHKVPFVAPNSKKPEQNAAQDSHVDIGPDLLSADKTFFQQPLSPYVSMRSRVGVAVFESMDTLLDNTGRVVVAGCSPLLLCVHGASARPEITDAATTEYVKERKLKSIILPPDESPGALTVRVWLEYLMNWCPSNGPRSIKLEYGRCMNEILTTGSKQACFSKFIP